MGILGLRLYLGWYDNVVNAGPIGTADAVIEPVYKPKSLAFKPPTKLEALNIWSVLAAAFINHGDVLDPVDRYQHQILLILY